MKPSCQFSTALKFIKSKDQGSTIEVIIEKLSEYLRENKSEVQY